MDKAAKRLAIIYVVLLSLSAPLMAAHLVFFIWIIGTHDMSGWMGIIMLLLPILIYGGVLVVLGIWNMVKSFQIYKKQDILGCINGMLLHKYGLVFFFCVNFVVLFIVYFILTFGVLVGTRGLALFAAPVWIPFVMAMLGWSIISSWLAILPGSAYSIQVLRGSVRTGKISGGAAVIHGILQFLFLADVLDAMYLAAGKWGRGKKSSVLVALVYVAAVAGIVWIVYKIRS